MSIDIHDRKILEILQNDVSVTNLDLAERVGLSPTPCARRVKALYDQGYIKEQVAVLNAKKLGVGLTVYVQIVLQTHTRSQFAKFEEAVLPLEEVVECALITGQDADYLLKIVVPDLDYYHKFLLANLTEIDGVKGVQSSFVLNTPKRTTKLPLDYVMGVK